MVAVKHCDERPRRARRRIAAVGASATVTVLSVGGLLGLVPGAQGTTLVHVSKLSSAAVDPTLTDVQPGDIAAAHPTGFSTPAEPAGGSEGAVPVDAPATSNPAQSPTQQASTYPIPAGTGSGKRIVFDLSEQRVWLVDADDQILRTYLGSGSRYNNLHTGHFEVYSRSKYALSYDYQETMRYMVRFDHGDSSPLGFHTIPVDRNGHRVQTVKQLGTPLSAGCVRQAAPDAKALWRFAPIGTDVWIVS
jgi:lipoprotein-anchoring transpeptidase ErfK/SrfK